METVDHGIASVKESKPNKRKIIIITVVVLTLLLAAAFFALQDYFREQERLRQEMEAARQAIVNSGVFHTGIYVNNIDLSGMTMEEGRAALKKEENAIKSKIRFQLMLEDVAYPVDASVFKPAFNTEEVLQDAMAIGREGTLEELNALLADLENNPKHFSLSYTTDESAVRLFVKGIAGRFNRLPQNARLDVLVAKTGRSEDELKSDEFVLAAASNPPSESMVFTQEIDGRILEENELIEALLLAVSDNKDAFSNITLPYAEQKAEITLASIQEEAVLRGHAYTSFSKSPYNRKTRVYNVQKATGLINGTMLQPGEVFSTNDTLGNRTYSAGWRAAPAIVRGRTEDQAGGGVCQVSSTLYNAVLKSDLEVVYRQGHSGTLGYIQNGLDATIDSGRIDFKFKNNTAAPIYIFGWVDTEKEQVHFEIYGTPFPEEFDSIELSAKRIQRLDPPGAMAYTIDPTKSAGYSEVYVARKSGSVWQSYATYLKNGEAVKQVKVDTTTYRAYAGETIIGPPAVAVDQTTVFPYEAYE